MSNICAYPLLNFNPYYRSNSMNNIINKEINNRPNTQSKFRMSENTLFNNKEEFKNSTHNNFYRTNNKLPNIDDEITDIVGTDTQTLYMKRNNIKNLGECEVKFCIENNVYIFFN